MLPAVVMGAAAGRTVGAGEGPAGAPSAPSTYTYGGSLIGVQWVAGDTTASTELALTGGAEPTSSDVVATQPPGTTTYETGTTTGVFWWVRHRKNGQFSSWVAVSHEDAGGGDSGTQFAPSLTGIQQLTDPSTCQAFCTGCVTLRITASMEGSSTGELEERADGGAWVSLGTIPAGSSTINRSGRDAGVLYEYRLRYTDVSPDTWSNIVGRTPECTQI